MIHLNNIWELIETLGNYYTELGFPMNGYYNEYQVGKTNHFTVADTGAKLYHADNQVHRYSRQFTLEYWIKDSKDYKLIDSILDFSIRQFKVAPVFDYNEDDEFFIIQFTFLANISMKYNE